MAVPRWCWCFDGDGGSSTSRDRCHSISTSATRPWLNARRLRVRSYGASRSSKNNYTRLVRVRRSSALPHEDELADFFRRQGAYLALFYGLGGSDFHRDNLIADGPYRCRSTSKLVLPGSGPEGDPRAPSLAYRAIAESVLRVGLLPRRVWGSDPWSGIDLSGLAGRPPQQTPFGVLDVERPGQRGCFTDGQAADGAGVPLSIVRS